MTKKSKSWSIKLFLAASLAGVGFFICIGAFVIMYKSFEGLRVVSNFIPREYYQVEKKRVNFIAVGDIMLSRNVARHAEKWGTPEWIWMNIRDFLRASDFVFGNLEGPTNGTSKYSYEKTMVFNALPWLIYTLRWVGLEVINLANNHILDQGTRGITETIKIMKDMEVKTIGASDKENEVWEPAIIEKNGIKIGFIGASYAAFNDNGSGKSPLVARMQDTEKLKTTLEALKSQVDYIVVTMHAGQEYIQTPTKLQKDFAHTAIDYGADIVIGAHPHWIQTVEYYKRKYIFYSLGNFVFDQEFSQETKNWLALQIFLEKVEGKTSLNQIELHPIIIENYGQPRLASPEESKKILNAIKEEKILY